MDNYFVKTQRVGMRKFADSDLDAFANLNADPHVMEYFPEPLTRLQCAEFMVRINAKVDEQGFGFWAAEHLETGGLMGFVGLTRVSYETHFTPAVEIGWRLATDYWGQGLATEAAEGCLQFAFTNLLLERVVSFTSILNTRSFHVMERLGMNKMGEFDHPKIASGHRLERHVWYQIERPQIPIS